MAIWMAMLLQKRKFFQQKKDDFAVLNLDDEYIKRSQLNISAPASFGLVCISNRKMAYTLMKESFIMVDGQEKFSFSTEKFLIRVCTMLQKCHGCFFGCSSDWA